MQGDTGRCREIQGDIRRYGEVYGGRYRGGACLQELLVRAQSVQLGELGQRDDVARIARLVRVRVIE